MSNDPLDELPPEMAAAWREREARERAEADEPAPFVDAEPAPGPATAEPEPEPEQEPDPEPETERRRSPLVAFLVLPLVGGAVLAVKTLGIAGWRGGPVLATVGLVLVAAAISFVLTRGQHLRAAYVVGAVVIALVGSSWSVSTAPLSHGRLEQIVDGIPATGVLVRGGTTRSGHGWCRPRCPTVTRTYLVPARQPEGALRNGVVAMQNAGMIPRDAGRVALARSMQIATSGDPIIVDNQRYTTVVRAESDPSQQAAGGSRITFEVTSRRGIKKVPASPVRAR